MGFTANEFLVSTGVAVVATTKISASIPSELSVYKRVVSCVLWRITCGEIFSLILVKKAVFGDVLNVLEYLFFKQRN